MAISLQKQTFTTKVVHKLLSWNTLKWLMLFVTLVISVLLLLLFYQGKWGLGKWSESSIISIDDTALIADAGPGQWRLKQLLITFFGGGALAFAGLLLQKGTRNNLAEVSILGIGSLNIMFIFAYVLIFNKNVFAGGLTTSLLPLVTIFSSVIGTGFIWLLARSRLHHKHTFVIVGIALQLLFEALAVVLINPTKLNETTEGKQLWSTIKKYTMGFIDAEGMSFWLIITSAIAIATIFCVGLALYRRITIYETSPSLTVTLGMKIEQFRLTIFVLVALLAGIEAALLGSIALLGIIAPSIARMLFRNARISSGVATFLIGGILVVIASIISTNFGTELPPGILATAITVPYFVLLMIRSK